MRKIFTKIICFTAAAVLALGVFLVAACSNVYNRKALPDYSSTQDDAVSNGGFAVEKGNYVYFINGKQTNTADNTFGSVEKGAIMRISKSDLANRNYSNVQTVVPHIAYSGNTNAGIFIYGDYVYYATPSTDKNSDGEVLNSYIAFKSTKLDGTDTMRGYYAQYTDNSIEYRFVEDNGVVYLIYVATSEDLYGTSCTNIHAVNTQTGENVLLAYNVGSVMFDKYDVTNPRIYYTMSVTDFVLGSTSSNYNQVWTVTPDGAKPNEYNFDDVEDYDAETDPLYVNCGTLVFDGIGKVDGMTESYTQFNSQEEGLYDGNGQFTVDRSAYTYALSSYENNTLFYTRTSTNNDSAMLFAAKDSTITASGWKPVAGNPDHSECLIRDGSSAGSYIYLFNASGDIENVLITDSTGLIKAAVKADADGNAKIATETDNVDRFYVNTSSQATLLFTAAHDDGNYIYYSLSGGNGYTVYRVCYDGNYYDYNGLPVEDGVNKYTPVQILDLDSASDWYKPELIENQILFPSQTENMTEFTYIMACDLNSSENSGKMMTNSEIDGLNEMYNSISDKIGEIDEEIYENLQNALWYAHFTNDGEYIDTLVKAYVDVLGYDEEHFWSKETVEKFKQFVAADKDGDWNEFSDTVKVNGNDVAANKRDYYYALLGKMTDEEAEDYFEDLVAAYLQSYPEKEGSWYSNLSTGEKAGFIIGVVAGGLLVIAAVVIVTLVVIRKRKEKLPVYKKRRIKVDTTDDKNIDVYSDEEAGNGGQTNKSDEQ